MNLQRGLNKIAAITLSIYCLTIESLQAFIPATIRLIVIIAIPTACILFGITYQVLKTRTAKLNRVSFSCLLMVIIILCWNNYSIKNGGLMPLYGILVPILFYFSAINERSWFKSVLSAMVVFGLFYSIWTILFQVNPSLYYNRIGPMIKSAYPYMNTHLNNRAGFTAHYSTNGIYLTNGTVASLCLLINYKKNKNKISKLLIISIVLQVSALLLTGKRGTLLCLIISFYITFFFYNANKPKGRVFRIVVISFVLFVLLYIASLIIPSLLNPYYHMLEMIDSNDISTGRFDLWKIGWDAFSKKPILGWGWRWFRFNISDPRFINHDTHNCYLQFLIELGIIGSLPFFYFIFRNYKDTVLITKAFSKKKLNIMDTINNPSPVLFCMIYQSFFLIFIFEGTGFYNSQTLFFYIASCALIQNLRKVQKYGDN